MTKAVLVVSSCAGGIALCIWGKSAFTAAGALVGVAAVLAGIFFVYAFMAQKNCPLFLGLGLIVLGAVLIILCLCIKQVPSFLGGIILIAAGCAVIPFCRQKIVLLLAGGCVAFGIIFIVMPTFAIWTIRLAGIFLIICSQTLLVRLDV